MKLLISSIFTLIILGQSISTLSASKRINPSEEKILVRIGNKSISVDEFIRRAEYTVRPDYCKGNTNIHKKIILNSLIAEKLFALEAGENNEFISNPKVESYLKGRKEQATRLILYDREVVDKAIVDSNLINKTFNQAERKYKIKYVSISDNRIAEQIKSELQTLNIPFERILKENYSLEEIPEREVSFNNSEHPKIIDSLFTSDVKKDQVIGPIPIETGENIFIQIVGWTDRPAITHDAVQKRLKSITDIFKHREEKKLFEEYIQKVMKGKKIVFEQDTFFDLADLFAPIYIRTEEQEKKMMEHGYLGSNDVELKINDIKPQLSELLDKTLLKINDSEWTVQKLLNEISTHPLVFRKNKIKNIEFGQELQFAIIDLVRDKYLTKEAITAGYDKHDFVKREYETWKDNLNFISERTKYLKSIGQNDEFEQNYISVTEKYLNEYLEELQKKYSQIVEINLEELEKIKLTKIDMAVTYSGSPFSQVVPYFPVITTNYHLDYGRKTDTAGK